MESKDEKEGMSSDGEVMRPLPPGEALARNQLDIILRNVGDAITAQAPDGSLVFANEAAARMLGYSSPEALMAVPIAEVTAKFEMLTETGDPMPIESLPGRKALRGGRSDGTVMRSRNRDTGAEFWSIVKAFPVFDEEGKVIMAITVVHDITALRQKEEQVRQIQKMDALGRLAGGVAHDFNNLLTAINGYSDLAMYHLREGQDDLSRNIQEIQRAGRRAAALTSQLLSLGRRQEYFPERVDLNRLIREMAPMLAGLAGEIIDVIYEFGEPPPYIEADAGLMEQVLLNLALNARDAMPEGGTLTIKTAEVPVSKELGEPLGLTPGSYVMLLVTDTGVGMSPEVKTRAFEPFFSSKGAGKGMGLGLATTYGIVQQTGGCIHVESEPGKGAAFKMFFFSAPPAALATISARNNAHLVENRKSVFIVEDDDAVRLLIEGVLTQQGFVCRSASDGEESLAMLEDASQATHLLITDLVLRGLDGKTLADRVATIRPGLKVLFISGYADETLSRLGISGNDVNFLHKPFTTDQLQRKVRALLSVLPPNSR